MYSYAFFSHDKFFSGDFYILKIEKLSNIFSLFQELRPLGSKKEDETGPAAK
jgi:hypothetical protein